MADEITILGMPTRQDCKFLSDAEWAWALEMLEKNKWAPRGFRRGQDGAYEGMSILAGWPIWDKILQNYQGPRWRVIRTPCAVLIEDTYPIGFDAVKLTGEGGEVYVWAPSLGGFIGNKPRCPNKPGAPSI